MDEKTGRLAHRTRAALFAAGLLALTGCTSGATTAPSTPTASAPASATAPTPNASASIAAALAAEEAALPMPSDRIADWAATSVPQPGDGGALASFHGWTGQTNGPRTSSEFSSLPAGSYQVSFACRGDSVLQVDLSSSEGNAVASAICTDETFVIPVTTTSPGLKVALALSDDGAPTVWATSFVAAPGT